MSEENTTKQYDKNKKSMIVAYLLLFFLGIFGTHRFYLKKRSTAKTILTLTSVGLISGVIAVPILKNTTNFIYLYGSLELIGGTCLIVISIWILIDYFLVYFMVQKYNAKLATRLNSQMCHQD